MPLKLPQPLIELQDRAKSKPDFQPQTGLDLHNDLYEYVITNRGKGKGIIEIGCYKGSSSIVLAYACQELQMPFYTIDINPAFLDYTRSLLSELGLADHTTFFCGTMTEFVLKVKLKNPPLLVFVDSDHNYFGVLKDIQAIYRLRKRPYAIAFHDFSLRSYAYENIRVDQAILDAFGKGVRYQRIGFQFGEKAVPGKDSPTEDGSYWDDNGSEGVIIETKAYKRLHL